jgi:peptide chain release factor 1
MTELNRLHKSLADRVAKSREYLAALSDMREWEKAAADPADSELQALARAESSALRERIPALEEQLKFLFIPKDPNDERNAILEIRAGTGGDEAGLFVADLWRMYSRYAERHNLRIDQVELSENSAGGFKEISGRVSGREVYAKLKYERGVHRVQRVPATESQGRIHTSTATVAVMPEDEDIDVVLDPADLEFEAMRSSGSGGQHVNTTDSAVRVTHKPTGIAVRCDQEKSQLKNRELAVKRLRSKLLAIEVEKAEAERTANRREQIGTGERSEKIRTYNYPQDRVTDHRIGLTRHNLPGFKDGDVDDMLESLRSNDEASRMKSLSDSPS